MAGSGPVFDEIDAAAAWLSGLDACTGKIGVIGFCLGGGFALLSAPRPGVSAASVNYAPVPKDIGRMLGGACPVVASYGGKDPGTRRQLPRLEQALTEQNVPHDVKVYPGASHAFMNEFEGASRDPDQGHGHELRPGRRRRCMAAHLRLFRRAPGRRRQGRRRAS